ncbi:hypothetical protein JMA_37560 (plasmid) [Jeotgalibacillus malaysiensis]|uniref:Gram-positive cocci surface proteins LPxTG domain-containing protein n=1 Tax=Jeotgalibacillus malaysiensis TaxID=1508404 RepID=A0A0B5AYJ4_9BACL|nr:LPXTG cell wall anchor domain-containing protein [Jeotgalibacillus malaysiensis]AJD93074.1 hypothetical protein JMA_37560 [Jeotgalibacillus malaysiensis]
MRKQVKKTLVAGSALGIVASSMFQPMIGHAEGEPVVTSPEPETAPVEETPTEPTPVEEPTEPSPAEPAEPVPTEPEPAPETPVEPPTEPAEPVEATPTEPTDPAEPPVESEPAPEEGAETVEEGTEAQAIYNSFDSSALPLVESELATALSVPSVTADDFTPENLAQITSLDVSGQGIEHLNGFEHLVNLTTLDISDNLITDLSPIQAKTANVDASFNLLLDASPYDYSFNLTSLKGNFTTDPFKYNMIFAAIEPSNFSDLDNTLSFPSNSSEVSFSIENLFRQFPETELTPEEMQAQLSKLNVQVVLEAEANSAYELVDNGANNWTLTDLGTQPAKIMYATVQSKLAPFKVKIKPKELNNLELEHKVVDAWYNAYGLALYVKDNNQVFYNSEYFYDEKTKDMYAVEIKEAKNGVRHVDMMEGIIAFTDGDGNLFLIDDSSNSTPGTENVVLFARNVKDFTFGQKLNAEGYWDEMIVVLKENGELFELPYTSNINVHEEMTVEEQYSTIANKISDMRFTSDFLYWKTVGRYGQMFMKLTGSDGYLYNIFPDAHRLHGDVETERAVKTPYLASDVKAVFNDVNDIFNNTDIVVLQDGTVHAIHHNAHNNNLSYQELAVKNVVDYQNHVMLLENGEVYKLEYDHYEDIPTYSTRSLGVVNAKQISVGYGAYSDEIFYINNNDELYYKDNSFDEASPGELIGTDVSSIRTINGRAVAFYSKSGMMSYINKTPWAPSGGFYNVAYLANPIAANTIIAVPEPPAPTPTPDPDPVVTPPTEPPVVTPPVTPPTDPEPPVVTPPQPPVVEPDPEPETPVVPTPEEPVEPPVVTPEPDVPPTPTIPEEPVIPTPQPEEPVDETPIDETPEEPVVEVPTEPILDDETDTDVITNPVIEKPSTETSKEEPSIEVTYEKPILKEQKPVVADDDSESNTAEEVDSLPQTGDPINPVSTGVGILSILAGMMFFMKRKKSK